MLSCLRDECQSLSPDISGFSSLKLKNGHNTEIKGNHSDNDDENDDNNHGANTRLRGARDEGVREISRQDESRRNVDGRETRDAGRRETRDAGRRKTKKKVRNASQSRAGSKGASGRVIGITKR